MYGKELIIDLHECDTKKFDRKNLRIYFKSLCLLIKMERGPLHFWDDVGVSPEEQQTDPKTKGTSAIQFILTSNITVHTLDLLGTVYINIFSCKDFDETDAVQYTKMFFGAKSYTFKMVDRT